MPTTFTSPDVPVPRSIDTLSAAGFEVTRPAIVRRTVLDTFDGRLHRAGLRLELREATAHELVLTDLAGTLDARLEWAGGPPKVRGDLPPGPFALRVGTHIRERALLPVLELRAIQHLACRRDKRGRTVERIALYDRISCPASSSHRLALCVAECTSVAGEAPGPSRGVATLERCGLDEIEGDLVTVVAASTGQSIAGRTSHPTIPLDAHDDARQAFRAVLRNLAATMQDNFPGTVDDLDPEFLHELRIAIRRTRSVLAEGKRVLPPEVRRTHQKLFAELSTATSRTRDLDVYLLGWQSTLAPLRLPDPSVLDPVLAVQRQQRDEAQRAMADVLASPKTQQGFTRWIGWLAEPDPVTTGGKPIGRVIARRIADAQAQLLAGGRAIHRDTPGERLHDLRKTAKKLRYLLECFGAILPKDDRKEFVAHLKSLQDNLGAHQDAEVHLHELRELAHVLRNSDDLTTDGLLALGRLIADLDGTRQQARDEFAEGFARYDTKANRRMLDRMLAEIARP